jgi:hypothetical protein
VRSASKAGINHWSTGHCKWASTIRHDHHVRDRSYSRCRIVKAEYPHGQTEFGRQPLDRAGTPTGQHRLQITSPRLRGHKMPGIAVGAVNHPLCASGHTRLTVLLLTGIKLSKRRDHQEASLSNCAAEAAAISAIPLVNSQLTAFRSYD